MCDFFLSQFRRKKIYILFAVLEMYSTCNVRKKVWCVFEEASASEYIYVSSTTCFDPPIVRMSSETQGSNKIHLLCENVLLLTVSILSMLGTQIHTRMYPEETNVITFNFPVLHIHYSIMQLRGSYISKLPLYFSKCIWMYLQLALKACIDVTYSCPKLTK